MLVVHNWVYHELRAYTRYSGRWDDLTYWQLAGGREVDFIVGDLLLAVEAKGTAVIHSDHLKGLRELRSDYPDVKATCIVCLASTESVTEDGILILPYQEFVSRLWAGDLF